MKKCYRCRLLIDVDEYYVQDALGPLCMDCVKKYIQEHFDIVDLARELGMKVVENLDEEPESETEGQLSGQLDMFEGGI